MAVEIHGSEELFWQVKMQMRDVLLSNKDFYETSFREYILFGELKRVVCFGLEEIVESTVINWSIFYNIYLDLTTISAPSDCWFFTSACTQIAADAFRRPIAAYSERKFKKSLPELYFPVLNANNFTYLLINSR